MKVESTGFTREDVQKPGIDFIVRRDDLYTTKFVEGQGFAEDLRPGEVQLRIEKFALTANNVTYAVYGDAIGYWGYFPSAEKGWGRPPVWGFAEVVASQQEGVGLGERYYGFYPISSYLTVEAKPNTAGLRDIAEHRLSLPKAYNQYFLTDRDPVYDPDHENEQMILRPLFVTSFLAFDFLQDKGFFDADAIALSSASSKTAYGIAFLLSNVASRIKVIGLTSGRNRKFTKGLGCYDQVFTYDEVAFVPIDSKVTYVDVAGSPRVRAALKERLGDRLVYSMALGDTHWNEDRQQASLAGEQEFFFAPTWLAKRTVDWGVQGYVERLAEAWRTFSKPVGGWMEVVEESGPEAILRVWQEHLRGRADPAVGNVLSIGAPGVPSFGWMRAALD